jgi:carbon monoxide dehydrogenase subunit G
MKLENGFEVPAPRERAWALLMDVPRVIPCMPGAELTETLADDHWKADVAVKLGPVRLSFDADVVREEVDEVSGAVALVARARERRGRGGATARIRSTLSTSDSGTRVDIVTDLSLTGAVARYGRALVEDVSQQLVEEFANCLQSQLAVAPADAPPKPPREPRGISLLLRAIWRRLTRRFRKG